ncbi:hypothetical protein B0H13DRAFT_2343153 [Mycena leptocephala]|nr:hypothetical protein B0H13DRAFT_2343153 [Mycena leptocephala]
MRIGLANGCATIQFCPCFKYLQHTGRCVAHGHGAPSHLGPRLAYRLLLVGTTPFPPSHSPVGLVAPITDLIPSGVIASQLYADLSRLGLTAVILSGPPIHHSTPDTNAPPSGAVLTPQPHSTHRTSHRSTAHLYMYSTLRFRFSRCSCHALAGHLHRALDLTSRAPHRTPLAVPPPYLSRTPHLALRAHHRPQSLLALCRSYIRFAEPPGLPPLSISCLFQVLLLLLVWPPARRSTRRTLSALEDEACIELSSSLFSAPLSRLKPGLRARRGPLELGRGWTQTSHERAGEQVDMTWERLER